MTSRELEILNTIYQLGGQAVLRIISKGTGLSSDYIYLISRELLKRKLIGLIANNIFVLTAKGKLFLERSRSNQKERMGSSLREVALSFGRQSKPLSSALEVSFINQEMVSEPSYLLEHNLGRSQTIESTSARAVQASIKRLTTVNFKRSKD